MMNGRQEKFKKIKELKKLIDQHKGLEHINLKELLKPEGGFAKEIVREAGLTISQLRKIFAEFKAIYHKYNKNPDEAKYQMYKLYPLIQYQINRDVIEKEFGYLIFSILDSLDSNPTEQNFKRTMDFMEALVAYAKTKA
ncbi:MAG: type III-A CRISPR-associated protein Csm2 [Thermodesulfobacterium geofontis]|uniref:CRISPR system Cms protein Csm2 n=1 Tax=Thermodesulfobacterium geofontis TaxID=1295609 RepID=A0A2N7Q5M3_9BACT|nr:MAG: type III-A CRISPR-associated protein Csm2 [Thermodesulfobacterium geofontis]